MRTYEHIPATSYTKNYLVTGSAYDSTKWNLGKGWIYKTDGGFSFFTLHNQTGRPMEESTAFACACPATVQKSSSEWYIYLADNATASATRRVRLYTYNSTTGVLTSNGFITMTLATATAHTLRDFKIDQKLETAGTVSASGTAVTGSGTSFSANRVAVGARIGFGSTDPTQITTWYRVSSVGSDTSITLASSAGTVAGGTSYVIEEHRPVMITTNATTTNGGVHMAKGITPEDYISSGTTIAAATTTDNIKGCYWLKDASTETNIVAAGSAFDAQVSATERDLYVLDLPVAGSYKVYKYNIRASLTSLSSGASTAAFSLATGNQAFTGTGSQNANLTLATAGHGAGSGTKSLYFITTTRVYRAATANITSGSTTWQSDNISEIPPGGTNTFAALSTLNTISYCNDADMFNIGTTGNFHYFTQYVTSGSQFSKIYGRTFLNLDQSTADSDHPSMFAPNVTALSLQDVPNANMCVICKNGTATTNNTFHILSAAADWDYANTSGGYLISPEISLTDAAAFYKAFVSEVRYVGQNEHTKPTEPFKVYFRTTNITTDATTGWTLLDSADDLSGFSGASSCQFKIIAKTLGETCIPARILAIAVGYNNTQTDSRWAFSDEKSVAASDQFAFRQLTQYGSSYPTLTIKLVDSVSGSTLVTDNSVDQDYGTWEKSTDGSSWGSFNTTDRASGPSGDDTYIRFTPTASLSGKIRAVLY